MNLFRYSSSWGHLKLPFRLALYKERVTDLISSLRPDPVSGFCSFPVWYSTVVFRLLDFSLFPASTLCTV